MSLKENSFAAILLVTVGLVYGVVVVFLSYLLGQHTLDQFFLGLQYGIWMAFYLHYCWRDKIHDHVSYLMQVPKLSHERTTHYLLLSAIYWGAAVLTIFAGVYYLKYFMYIPQQWMETLNNCGRPFEINLKTGKYKIGKNSFMMPEGQKIG